MMWLNKILSFPFIVLIKIYQWVISPWLGKSKCRYTPSCSQYALEAFKFHGPLIGFWLTTKRVLRCNPWGGYGYDPIPFKINKPKNTKKNVL